MPTEPESAERLSAVWEVLQNGRVVCSAAMKLTKGQAENKVENERRMGNFMEVREVKSE